MTDDIKGRAVGGKAAAAKLTPEQRKERARKAVEARWERQTQPTLIKRGELSIAGASMPCAVVDMGGDKEPVRVLSENGITNALLGSRSGASKRLKKKAEESGAPFPLFVAPSQLKPFIDNDLLDGPLKPIKYHDGTKEVFGYDATALPVVCDIWLRAREAGALQRQQLDKAQKAEILTRALAKVAIIALVDEATGFQKERAKDALAKILEAFVAKELQPYLRRFPSEYYEHLFRIYSLPYPPEGNKSWRPAFFGKITNDIVYSRLAPELLPELKKAASKSERKTKLHQWLTSDIGHPKLRDHLSSVVTLLKLSSTPDQLKSLVNQIHPRFGDSMMLDFNQPAD